MTFSIIERFLNNSILVILCLSLIVFFRIVFFPKKKQYIFLYNQSLLVSFILITLVLIIRWISYNHFPFANLYESCLFLSWCINLIVFVLSKKNKISWLNFIVSPSILGIFLFAIISIPKEIQNSTILVPALQSNWLMMHVSMMILSYGFLICGSLLAITILVLSYNNSNEFIYASKYNSLQSYKDAFYNNLFFDINEISFHIFSIKRYILIDQLDNWSYRTIGIGFIFLTIGILSGAVWANEAWGSYWNWDPKETWALITWLLFAIYLHTRIVMSWKPQVSALIAFIGFLFIWICYLGVNILGKGFHSYGWLN